ncbi:hypothetical protein ES703_64360 [subsurface metagenome]
MGKVSYRQLESRHNIGIVSIHSGKKMGKLEPALGKGFHKSLPGKDNDSCLISFLHLLKGFFDIVLGSLSILRIYTLRNIQEKKDSPIFGR